MLVKDLMEDNKLDLNKPLLSVRRQHPSTSGVSSQRYGDNRIIPRYKSELKSGPIRNPGSVPFHWERTPGLPKEDRKPQLQNQVAAKLPPGKANRIDSNHSKSPFGSMRGSSVNEVMIDYVKGERKSCSSGDCDEEFADARDTLSMSGLGSGSSCLNCSNTGLDDLDGKASSGNFSTDGQTQGLMMERFLPAAKALASDKPKYSPTKQSSVRQQMKQKALIRPALRYGPSFTQRYSHFGNDAPGEGEGEDEDEETYYHPSGCGLLPRLLKGSSAFFNPVPGSSMRMRGPFPLDSRTRTRPESSSSGSMNEFEPSSDVAAAKKKIQWISEDTAYVSFPKNTGAAGFSGLKTIKDKASEKGSDSVSVIGERSVYVDSVGSMSWRSGDVVSKNRGYDMVENEMYGCLDSCYEDVENQGLKPDSEIGDIKASIDSTQQSASDSENPPTTLENKQNKCYQLPVPPPLPKSPTDSWLCRTLPSMSKNATPQPFLSTVTKPWISFKVHTHNEEFV